MVKTLAGRKVVLDTCGEGFREAVGAGPWLVNTNAEELEELVETRLDAPSAVLHQARNLIQRCGISSIVVSLGREGTLFVEAEESVWARPQPSRSRARSVRATRWWQASSWPSSAGSL